MLHAITIGWPHDGKAKPKVIAGPEVPIDKQRSDLKMLGLHRENKEFAKVEIWTSQSGVINSRKFITPAEIERRKKVLDQLDKPKATEPAEKR